MRHRKGFKKLNRTSSHRKAMFANMAESLLKHERIKTTLVKAKSLRPYVEKIITKAKEKNLSTIRYLSAIFHDKETVQKLTDDIGQRVAKRQGGYTRIYKIGFRPGDATDMALIELVDKKVIVADKKKDDSNKKLESEKKEEAKVSEKEMKEVKELSKEKKTSPVAKKGAKKPVKKEEAKPSSKKVGKK